MKTNDNDNWLSKLNQKELIHLLENNITTLDALKRTREQQRKSLLYSGIETCWKCKFIARKLKIEA
ncbi:hypothetical protein M0R04_09370 [Candidatus Dojkabacteria bacterium]|jgi:hypothetical protein|nr:hypothetical protein [Candidatus Dojkabacteria bacterium]